MSINTARADGRRWDAPRPVSITVGYQRSAEGSAMIEMGGTRVLCAASLEERVPAFLRGQGTRMGDGRVFHAAPRDQHPLRPRARQRAGLAGARRKFSGSSDGRCGR